MNALPRIARIACIVAFIMAGLVAVQAAMGPIALLPAALVPLCSAIGIMRRRVWGAWGMAVYSLAQLILVPLVLSRSAISQAASIQLGITAALSIGVGTLFFFAGRSLAAAGAARGHAWPWFVVSALVTLPLLFVQPFVNPTGSMEDTLLVGDRIIVQRFPPPHPELGDVMALVYPVDRRQTFIKRIVGMPGDRIRISRKALYRNGIAVEEPWATHKLDYEDSYRDDFPSEPNTAIYPQAQEMLAKDVVNGEVVVPPGKYFVLGDNRDQSLDSRYWGFVSEADFIGKPLIVYDSVDANTGHRWARLFRVL